MFDVVTCGFVAVALRSLPEHQNVTALPSADSADFVEQAYTALRERDPDRRVLVLHPSRAADTRKVMVVRALLQSSEVAPVPLLLPVTALAATASWLAALAERGVSAGSALASLGLVAEHLPSYAATTSVARLDLPQVGLVQHLMSWLPGSVFGIAFDGPPRVEIGQLASRVPLPEGSVDLVTAGDTGLADKLRATVPSGVQENQRLEVPASGALWWGKSRYYEHCVVPHDIDAFTERIRHSEGLTRCPQCGDAMQLHCRFCFAQEGVHV